MNTFFKKNLNHYVFVALAILFFLCIAGLLLLRVGDNIKESFLVHKIESFYKLEDIKAVPHGDDVFLMGTVDGDSNIHNEKGKELYYMCSLDNCLIQYDFEEKKYIKKVEVVFIGMPKSQDDIIFFSNNKSIDNEKIVQQCDKNSSICSYYFTQKMRAGSLSISLRNATFKNYGIRDVKFFTGSKIQFVEAMSKFLFVWKRGFFSYMFYPLLFFILFIIPGLLFGELARKFNWEFNFIISLIISTVLWIFFYGVSSWLSKSFLAVFVFMGLILFVYLLLKKNSFLNEILKQNKKILSVYIFAIIVLSLTMFIRDHQSSNPIELSDFYKHENLISYGTYETDFLIPYESALNFTRGGDVLKQKIGGIYNITDRTPFISFLYANYGKLFGFNVFTYQMFIVMISSLFIIGIFYLGRLFMDDSRSYLLAVFASFSHFFIPVALFGPAKTATLFFIIAAAVFLLKKDINFGLAGISIAIAYLFHPFALVYFLSFAVFAFILIYDKNNKKKLIKPLVYFCLPIVVCFSVWTGYSKYIGNNNLIYTSVSTGETWAEASRNIMQNKYEADEMSLLNKNFWMNKLYNGIGLFNFSFDGYPESRQLDYFRSTIPGSVGIFFTILLVVGFVYFVRRKTRAEIIKLTRLSFCFVVLPIFFTLMYLGFFVRLGIMWYVLGIIPFLYLSLGIFYSYKWLSIFGFFIISESFYLLVVYDRMNYDRFIYFFSGEKVAILFTYGCIVGLYLIFVKKISNANSRT